MNPRSRVLVVEDDPAVRGAVRALLRRLYEVVAVDGVPSALMLLDEGARFAVIISDVQMVPMNGMEFHAALTARFPDQAARMIFVTGSASEPLIEKFLASVRNRHFPKPFEPRLLLDAMAAVLHELSAAPPIIRSTE